MISLKRLKLESLNDKLLPNCQCYMIFYILRPNYIYDVVTHESVRACGLYFQCLFGNRLLKVSHSQIHCKLW